jgi:hypothetical protein
MKRTTKIELIAAVRVLNHLIGIEGGKPGSFVLQGAYGGWQLQRIHPSGGNESVTTGFRTKREVLDLIHAIRYGIREGLGMTLTN